MLSIHDHQLSIKSKLIDATGNEIFTNKTHFTRTSEKILSKSNLHLNHYPIQSKEWFLSVKCTRGSADSKEHEHARDLRYFEEYDQNCNVLSDTELANKSYP